MTGHTRRVLAATRGPIGDTDKIAPSFLVASIGAHLRDALRNMREWDPKTQRFVALPGTSQAAVDDVARALELLDVLGRQSDG